jgi:DUF1680 family protein
VEVEFSMPVVARRPHPRVRSVQGRVALTRGPVVYCVESVDNAGLDPLEVRVDRSTVRAAPSPDLFDGAWVLKGRTTDGEAFSAIPYFYWANRGESRMAVWVRT